MPISAAVKRPGYRLRGNEGIARAQDIYEPRSNDEGMPDGRPRQAPAPAPQQGRQAPGIPAIPGGSPVAGYDPRDIFGASPKWPTNVNPFFSVGVGENRTGAGSYGLPPAYTGWGAPARNAVPFVFDYADRVDPTLESLRQDAGRDFEGELYGISSDTMEAQFSDAKRKREQGFAQAGYGGGGTVSPFAAQQLQLEGAARAGQLGNAARQSVIQAQALKAEASRNYLNAVQSRLMAMLIPAQLQLGTSTKQPTGTIGPTSLAGPILNAGASVIGALS
jgi:hypothetical protein